MSDLEFKQKLLFVTGKGGTGKTFVTGILGMLASEQGKKVLLVDSESTGELARHFEHEAVGYEPIEVAENIFICQIKTDEALSEYLNLNAKIPTWAKLTPLARLIDLVANAAPGVKEILVTGKICYEMKKINDGDSDFDVIYVDAPSSGHVISLLDAPRALSELVTTGMIQSQTQWMQDILSNSQDTGVLVTCLSDEVVLSETRELVNDIEAKTAVEITGVVINKDSSTLDLDPKKLVSKSKVPKPLDKLVSFYLNGAQISKEAIAEFKGYDVFAYPQLNDHTSLLRSLRKNAHRFVQLNSRNK